MKTVLGLTDKVKVTMNLREASEIVNYLAQQKVGDRPGQHYPVVMLDSGLREALLLAEVERQDDENE